jgi:CBS domain-containing protein
MSPRAAWRLETLGFTHVFDYVAGKADWFASGLPREGRDAAIPRAGDVARRDVPTCRLTDRVRDARERSEATGWDQCLVVNERRILLGRLRGAGLAAPDETVVEEVMESGPTTIRPDTRLDALTKRMRERHVDGIVVTTPDGRLLGILVRKDAEREDESSRAAATP